MRVIDADALKSALWETWGYNSLVAEICEFVDEQPTIQSDEPRVMTLDEINNSLKTQLWKETKSSNKDLYTGWVLAYDIQTGLGITGTRLGMSEPNGRVVWYKLDDYGRKWRCWTARPTDEQRKAVKWE